MSQLPYSTEVEEAARKLAIAYNAYDSSVSESGDYTPQQTYLVLICKSQIALYETAWQLARLDLPYALPAILRMSFERLVKARAAIKDPDFVRSDCARVAKELKRVGERAGKWGIDEGLNETLSAEIADARRIVDDVGKIKEASIPELANAHGLGQDYLDIYNYLSSTVHGDPADLGAAFLMREGEQVERKGQMIVPPQWLDMLWHTARYTAMSMEEVAPMLRSVPSDSLRSIQVCSSSLHLAICTAITEGTRPSEFPSHSCFE